MSAPPLVVELRVVAGRATLRRVELRCESGRVIVGEPTDGAAPDHEPDAVWTLTEPDARALASGELDPGVAYMRGRMKTAGETGAPLRVLPRLRGEVLADLRDKLS